MKGSVEISVLLAVYNGSLYLKECIDSILYQSFTEFELLIINDGSVDSTREIILSYDDSRIRLIENSENRGLVYSLNLGLSLAQGKYIARMDADDIALPKRLQTQFDFMEAYPETGICGSSVEAFYENTGKRRIVSFPQDDVSIRAFCFFQSPFCHPTVMIRKSVLVSSGLQYSDEYYRAEDYALWVELLNHTQGANLPDVLVRYRKHSESETVLADRRMDEKLQIVSCIQKHYLFRYGISLFPAEMAVYTCFTDRSIPCRLAAKDQRAIDKIVRSFLYQLPDYPEDLRYKVVRYLSQNSFYTFFVSKRLPITGCLRKLYCRGGSIYFKRLLIRKSS